jgi:eukaryotic-like serine/threonine-protein kinase
MPCLDANALNDFTHGFLTGEALRQVEEHVDGCADCQRLVAQAMQASAAATVRESENPSSAMTREESAARSPVAVVLRGTPLGRYLVVDCLGVGGMGVVYRAYDPELNRRVALKVLRNDPALGSTVADRRARLLREAQALAKLTHPNVIAVHDVGTFGDQVFMAMEFIDGGTLKTWLAEKRRSWREVVAMFRLAGEGLAAAHRAGLIHRDFKPDNVLVGKDGRVCVTDFGLVRPATEGPDPEEPTVPTAAGFPGDREPRPTSPLHTPLTHAGMFMGTPAYMSPEQLNKKPVDARSDQFGFCVTLYEALYGERPFAGHSFEEMREEVSGGRLRDPKRHGGVPSWLRRVLVRGMKVRPEDRYASMEELLAALAADPAVRRRRRIAIGGAIALGVAVAAAAIMTVRKQSHLCKGVESRLAGIWDAPRKDAIHHAFSSINQPYAEPAWTGVERAIDAYAAGWTQSVTEACEATRIRGEQSEAMLGRRMACLNERLQELESLTSLFAGADARIVERAVSATTALPSLSPCADLVALNAGVEPPQDRTTSQAVEDMRAQLFDAKARLHAGKYREGLAIAEGAAKAAAKLGYAPLQGETLALVGELQDKVGEYSEAQKSFEEAARVADVAHNDEVRARALTDLVYVVGVRQSSSAPAEKDAEDAKAAIARLGGNAELEATRLLNLGWVYRYEDRFSGAETAFREALAIRERLYGHQHLAVADALNSLGMALDDQWRLSDALTAHREALAIREKLLGSQHPEVAESLMHVGIALRNSGQFPEAETYFRRSASMFETLLGPDHPDVATALGNLASVLVSEEKFVPAREAALRSLAIREKVLGPDATKVAFTLEDLAHIARLEGHPQDALAYDTRALAIREKALGPKHSLVADSLTDIGECYLSAREPERAIEPLERALKLREELPPSPKTAATRFALAKALWNTRRDVARARALATRARDDYAGAGEGGKRQLEEVNAWLTSHGAG